MKYRCYHISGGGREYEEGIFEVVSETKQFLTLEMKKKGFFCMFPDHTIRKIPKEGAAFRSTEFVPTVHWWGDGSFSVYHMQYGKPYIYEPVTN